jgi:GNAT superfamily N-acetyltransferase
MQLESLSEKDLPQLAAFAKKALPELGYLDAKGWREQCWGDPDADGAYWLKAVKGKAWLGAAIGVARGSGEKKTGWVKLLAVEPKARRQGTGRALLAELERRFQKRDCHEARFGACPPPYVNGGVPILDTAAHCFLLARGYERSGTVIDMVGDLRKLKPLSAEDQKLLKAAGGRRAGAKDAAPLKAMLQQAFPYWVGEVEMGLRKGVVWVAGPAGSVTAFACADGTHPGWFGPMGTLESERGKGLGRLLMAQCLQHLKKRGVKAARIPWVGPIPFYRAYAAAELGPLYWTFSKRL